jgi:hypothetical protein
VADNQKLSKDPSKAQVVPLHKKNDPLDKKYYRPVSILPTISKIYEMVLSDQLVEFFNNIFQIDCVLLCCLKVWSDVY